MSAGGNYGPLGYLEDTAETDLLYIRRDEYNVRGQIGTYDNIVGDFSVLPPGSNGYILTARPALSNGLAWEAPTAGSITVNGSTFLTVTGSPVSLGGTVTLTNTALNDYFGVGCWGAGNSISFGAGATYTLLIGNSCLSAAGSDFSIAMGANARAGGDQCISIGYLAGSIASTGPRNIYIGTSTGAANTSATGQNIFIGYNAGLLQSACANSVIIGADGGAAGSTAASQTICLGSSTTIRDSSVIIGHSASAATTRSTVIGWTAVATQASDVAIGDGVGVSGARSVGVGSSANITGADAVGVGASVAAGTSTTVVGSSAGGTSATFGVIIGHDAGDNSPGADLVSIGYQSGRGPGVANCTFIGKQAGNACTGGQNTLIGWTAGSSLITGTLNTLIGNNVQPTASTVQGGVAVGAGNTVNANSTALGQGCNATGTSAVAVGQGASAGGNSGTAVGRSASCSGSTGLALGANSSASATTANAIGYLVSNAITNTTVIGTASDTAHIVKSTGFFRSARPYSCQAGRTNGTTQTVTLPGPSTLTIANTPWDNIGGSVSGNTILVQDVSMWYRVTAVVTVNGFTSVGLNALVLRINYYNGATTSAITASSYNITATSTEAFISCTGCFQATASAGQYVFCELQRYLSGTTSDPVVNFYTLTLERCV